MILRIARRQGLGSRNELREEFVRNLALDDDAARVETNLALVEERTEGRGAHRVVDVDIVENDHRVEAAKLHRRALERFAGALREHLRGLDTADQIDDPHIRALEEDVGDIRRGPGRVGHDIDDAFRESRLLRDLRENDARPNDR